MIFRCVLYLSLGLLMTLNAPASAKSNPLVPRPGQQQVTGVLSMDKDRARLIVNPMSRIRYIYLVQNLEDVARWLKREDVFGRVHATIEVIQHKDGAALAIVREIHLDGEPL